MAPLPITASSGGPETTLLLDPPSKQEQPGQTQIQFVPLPMRDSRDRTLFDPRGHQTVILKPDETIIDPRGEQTVILPPRDEPPSKA